MSGITTSRTDLDAHPEGAGCIHFDAEAMCRHITNDDDEPPLTSCAVTEQLCLHELGNALLAPADKQEVADKFLSQVEGAAAMNNVINQFRTAMMAAGMDAPDVIHDDGVLHRFTTGDKRGKKNGWYFLHGGADTWGQAGIWNESGSDAICHWSAKSTTTMTPAERDAHRQRVKDAQAQREANLVQRNEAAAVEAERLWKAAKPCTGNTYGWRVHSR